ncbi:MAG: tetratricopeptide repeat protein [Candidatus Hinthialibacter antarcticus]|nr:tetratricopeptide repeat protein [Candidatus Hinthialibacter antarcticus]
MRLTYLFCTAVLFLVMACALHSHAQSGPSLDEIVARGRQAASQYHYEEAAKWYALALQQSPGDADLHFALAMQYIGLERIADAEQSLLRSVELDPQFALAHTNLGILYQQFQNDFTLAETYYRHAIHAGPKAPAARRLLGEMYLSMGKHNQALEEFQALIQAAPNSHFGYLGAAQSQLRNGETDAAIRNLLQAAKLAPKEPDPFRFLAQALAKKGDREKAKEIRARFQALHEAKIRLDDLQRLVRREPDNAQRWFAYGKEYVIQKDADEAIHAFEIGLKLDPGSDSVHALLGALYLMKQKPLEALDHLEPAAKALPNDVNAQNHLGVCYLMLNDYARAVTQFEKAITLGGANPGIQKNLDIAIRKAKQVKP